MQVAGQRRWKRGQSIGDVGWIEQLFLNFGVKAECADAGGEHVVESGREFGRCDAAHDLRCLDECVVGGVGHRAVARGAVHGDAAGTRVFFTGGEQYGRAVVAE